MISVDRTGSSVYSAYSACVRLFCILLLIKPVSRKIDFSSLLFPSASDLKVRASTFGSQTLCLKNNSIYRLRSRWNPQTLSLATHDGWRGDNVEQSSFKQLLCLVVSRNIYIFANVIAVIIVYTL